MCIVVIYIYVYNGVIQYIGMYLRIVDSLLYFLYVLTFFGS